MSCMLLTSLCIEDQIQSKMPRWTFIRTLLKPLIKGSIHSCSYSAWFICSIFCNNNKALGICVWYQGKGVFLDEMMYLWQKRVRYCRWQSIAKCGTSLWYTRGISLRTKDLFIPLKPGEHFGDSSYSTEHYVAHTSQLDDYQQAIVERQ